MPRQITFDSDGDAIESSENEIDEKNSDFNKGSLSDVDSKDDESPNEGVFLQPVMNHYDESDDDDDAPEEVSVTSSKAHMMDIYKKQKEVAVAYLDGFGGYSLVQGRERESKDKSRWKTSWMKKCCTCFPRIRIFALLVLFSSSLSAETTMAKEDEMSNKRINLEAASDSTRKVEKKV